MTEDQIIALSELDLLLGMLPLNAEQTEQLFATLTAYMRSGAFTVARHRPRLVA
ncbi:MAG: hypothetical protein M3P11_12945 [Actinomycetota bacterium]|nr:hypothetical protein [Actinomycetota bacterium]MDP9331530.1 hypothetical protein [Actinomycetota bacterium]